MKILVIEDDLEAAAFLSAGLRSDGHELTMIQDGREGLVAAVSGGYDLLILDRMLPSIDGLTILRTLRVAKVGVPVLFLTTIDGVDDRVEGLRAGADDYLVKPFAFEELSARVTALARRRSTIPANSTLRIADLELDRMSQTVTRAGKRIVLQQKEFQLLEYLMLHENQVVTRTMILEAVWHYHFMPVTLVVESHISRLRRKIDRDFGQELIHTCRGSGYKIGC
ncbi:response regulator transcription factor [Acidocella aromatica]|uniref:Two-component system OmpR family response regulator n=1 Tax=Acidocella aromatica TaxID=1303579 RepID=A0A840VDT5_9PROT|nr:response regulator transcription factor [Acidocella aromatica]MBB5373864.1 two-component system OmpR family response regulator [Acidocella aromatica]